MKTRAFNRIVIHNPRLIGGVKGHNLNLSTQGSHLHMITSRNRSKVAFALSLLHNSMSMSLENGIAHGAKRIA